LSSLGLHSENFKFPVETDEYKFIPKGSAVMMTYIYTEEYGPLRGLWYDKDCKTKEDYEKRFEENNNSIPRDEFFLDFNYDGILDSSLKDLDDLVIIYWENKKLEKTSL
jgi:hypothetical protein